MATWSEARKRNSVVRDCAQQDPVAARDLWMATKGDGDPELDSYTEAALDTAPSEYASVLALGGTANAFALKCLWEHRNVAKHETPFQRRELARKAWIAFADRAKQAADVQYGLGFDESDAWESTRDFRTDHKTDEMVRIAKMAGRIFAQLQRAKSEQVAAAPEDLHSVELGSNLMRLLPSELIHLGQPTEILLLDNLANHKALQFQYRGTDDGSKGPLVICADESGSMSGERGEWCKAATIALVRAAWEDDRHCSVVHWSRSVHITDLPVGDTSGLLKVIKHWFGGGNDAALALENGADEVDRLAKKGNKGSDVILITDGVEDITSRHTAAIDRVEALGARLWTVAVECPIDRDNPLRARAEEYIPIGGAELREGGIGAMKGAVL